MISLAIIEKLKEIVGAEHALTGPERDAYVLDGQTPDAVVLPASVDEVSRLLALASEERLSVTPWGGGTKIAVGSPLKRLQLVVGLKRLNRLLEHEPGDLTATVEAGITHETLQTALARHGQWLSLDPPFGSRATLGGIVSANSAGPRRHLYGSARDLVIGVEVVASDGALVHGGGKVVKNVAGYDLPKLYIGALGTLGIVVGLTVKLRPLPEEDGALLATFPRILEASAAARALINSDLIPHAVELLDGEAAMRLARTLGREAKGAGLLVGFDGLTEQVSWQLDEAERLFQLEGALGCERLRGTAKEDAWRFVREIGDLASVDPAVQARIAILPTQLHGFFEKGGEIARRNRQNHLFAAHAGLGFVTAVLSGEGGEGAAVETLHAWREIARGLGGQLSIDRAPRSVKEKVSVWEPLGSEVKIMERIKAELDPEGIMNPGRFVGGI